MITGCPDCPHQGDGNSQAGLQAHINRVPGPTVVDAALALAADRPSATDNARADEQRSEYTVQDTAAYFARKVQRVSDRIRSTDYQRSVSDIVGLDSIQGFLDRVARDDLDMFAAGPAETTPVTAADRPRVGDQIATAEQLDALPEDVILRTAGGNAVTDDRHLDLRRVWIITGDEVMRPSLAAITDYGAMTILHIPGEPSHPSVTDNARAEAEVRAEALEEAAAAWAEDPDQIGDSEADARNWLRDRADTLRAGGRRG